MGKWQAAILVFTFSPLYLIGQDGSPTDISGSCTVPIEQSPSPQGLRLGMTISESTFVLGRQVKARHVNSKLQISETMSDGAVRQRENTTRYSIGEEEFAYYPRADSNIGSLYLRFWKDRLYTILLDYDIRDFEWKSAITSHAIAKKFSLQTNGWQGTKLVCEGFYLRAVKSEKSVQIEITDSKVKSEIREEAEKAIVADYKKLWPRSQEESSEILKTIKSGPPPVLKRKK